MINIDKAKEIGDLLGINYKIIPLRVWHYAVNVEMEHGSKYGELTNVIKDDPILSGKIALAHLIEYPDYYQRLYKMEKEAKQYWNYLSRKNRKAMTML